MENEHEKPSPEIRVMACEWMVIYLLGITTPREAMDRMAFKLSDPKRSGPLPGVDPDKQEAVRRHVLRIFEMVEALRPPS